MKCLFVILAVLLVKTEDKVVSASPDDSLNIQKFVNQIRVDQTFDQAKDPLLSDRKKKLKNITNVFDKIIEIIYEES